MQISMRRCDDVVSYSQILMSKSFLEGYEIEGAGVIADEDGRLCVC